MIAKLETILWQLRKTRLQTCVCPPSFWQSDSLKVQMTPLEWEVVIFLLKRGRDRGKERKREVLTYTLWKHLVKVEGCVWLESDPFQPVCLSWCCLHIRLMYKLLCELRVQWQKRFKTTYEHIIVSKFNFLWHASPPPSFFILIFLNIRPINQSISININHSIRKA